MIWPTLAQRIPQFEAIKVVAEWAGHYDMNMLDHNAIVGPHPRVRNFHFLNGFSGHGLQHSPAIGRGAAEMIAYGEFRTLDLSPFGYDRIEAGLQPACVRVCSTKALSFGPLEEVTKKKAEKASIKILRALVGTDHFSEKK